MSTDGPGCRIAVVGGGIAGLASAFRIREELRAAGRPFELAVFEQACTCGGATRTDHVDGFSLDRGPNGWLSNEPLTARLIDELGLTGELARSEDAARHRFIFTRGKLHRLPDSPGKFLTTDLLGPWQKLRVLGELFTRGRKDDADETIYEFGRRRLGRGFSETMLDPMVSGIFAGDFRALSLPATFPKMRRMELEHGGLFRAMIAKKRDKRRKRNGGGPAGPSGILTTLRGGAGRVTDALAGQLAGHVRTGCAAQSLTRAGDDLVLTADGVQDRFDAVVVAVPAHAAAGILEDLSPKTAAALGDIEFADVAVVCHVYDPESLATRPVGFGHLIPRPDGIRSLGCLWTSCIFPDQVPGDELLLRTILGGATDGAILELSDDELLALVKRDTATTLGIRAEPARTWIFRHPRGIAQYTLGHRERVAAVEALCADLPRLAFVGASYRGVSLNRCVRDAYTVAPRVLRRFGIEVPAIPDDADRPVLS